MSFFRLLQGIGDRLGILEPVSSPGRTAVVRVETKIVTLQELESEIKNGDVCSLAASPEELHIPFEKIFEAAGISTNPDDWTIGRLKQLVTEESFKGLSHEEAQKKVLELFGSEGVSAEEIVRDAIARDRALDSFESCVNEKMQARREGLKKRMREIETRIEDLQREKASVEVQLKIDEEQWNEWKKQKRAHERELAWLASYIVDHPVITSEDDVP